MGKLQSCRKSLQEQEKISAYGSVFSRNHASSCYCCTAVGLCVCDSSGARKRWSLETQDGEVLWAVRTATHPCATTHRNQGLRVCVFVCDCVWGGRRSSVTTRRPQQMPWSWRREECQLLPWRWGIREPVGGPPAPTLPPIRLYPFKLV